MLEIALVHGCSPVNLLHIFRTCFSKNTSDGLLYNQPWAHVLTLHLFCYISNQGQALALKVAHIFKVFGAQSAQWFSGFAK